MGTEALTGQPGKVLLRLVLRIKWADVCESPALCLAHVKRSVKMNYFHFLLIRLHFPIKRQKKSSILQL